MNGLEQILLKIEQDNQKIADEMLAQANRQADKIVADAQEQAKLQAEQIRKNAEKKSALILENSESGCTALVRREKLSAKTAVISKWLDEAVEQAKKLQTQEYFVLISKLIVRYAHDGNGVLLMNKNDHERMPNGFVDGVNKLLAQRGASVTIGETEAETDSGFVLQYGGIEENCSFDALLDEKKDFIKDKLYALLEA